MLLVGLAVTGAVGAPMRYLVDGWVRDRTGNRFPWGTLAVNVSASLIVGFLTGLALYHGLSSDVRVLTVAGWGGAYSTASTWLFESQQLAERGMPGRAVANLLGSFVAGVVAAATGIGLAGLP